MGALAVPGQIDGDTFHAVQVGQHRQKTGAIIQPAMQAQYAGRRDDTVVQALKPADRQIQIQVVVSFQGIEKSIKKAYTDHKDKLMDECVTIT